MFRRLRNRLLIVNMAIITLIMLAAFASIYTITYRNVQNDIGMELQRVDEFYHKPKGEFGEPKINRGNPPEKELRDPPAERSVSFALQTDASWNLTTVDSRFDMDDEFYALAAEKAASGAYPEGRFTLDGNRWAYKAQSSGTGYTVVFLDVTARQKIVTNLIYTFLTVGSVMLIVIFMTSRYFASRSIAPVKEAFEKQKRFIADASHELKTPLAVISTNADALLANSDDTIRNQAKWLHHIKSETERMKTLTSDLLYLTEMEDARTQMLHAPFNASEAVESVLLTMEAVIFERDISLDYEIEPGLTVHGNSEQLKQVIMILLDNAVKFAGPKGAISLSLRRRNHDMALSVSNTGEGIPQAHLERIFDRFYRVDASRSRNSGGHGLGLAIAKSIVEQHKGRIYARSAPNESTTFHVTLPLV